VVAKPKNTIASEALPLTLTPGVIEQLERITATNLYGKNANETAAQILSHEIRRLILSGELDKLLATRPLTPDGRSDAGDAGE
jgi:hypothetical protein